MGRNAIFISALIYTGISLAATGTFVVVATLQNFDAVARAGGAVWVFLLSMIILMPLVTPAIKRRLGGRE